MFNIIEADLSAPAHAEALVQLLNEYASGQMGGGEPLSDYVKQNLAAELHKRPTARAVLAFDGNTPAGLIICIEGFSTFLCKPLLNIHDVIVSEAYRGKGLFRLMLAKVESIAHQRGCCKLTLEVLEGNEPALMAYKANGFAGYELDPKMGRAVFWQKKFS